MSLFSGLLGNAAKVDLDKLAEEFSRLLAPGERVEHAYQLIRDYFLFTSHRLILVDKQGLTGRKTEFHSIPYRSITQFCVETAGTLDMDSELKIWISGTPEPLCRTFSKGLNIYEVQSVLANYIFK